MRVHLFKIFFITVLLWGMSVSTSLACTVFVMDNGERHYYGSNFDWHRGAGFVIVNQRGVTKHGWPLPDDPGTPEQWSSRFGSVTFVQFGQGLPKGGMNEAGLVTESLLMPGTEYPAPDDRPYIGSTSQLNQYLLDTCATVEEVVRRLSRIRVATYDWAPGVHFMVADARGDCAVIEFLEGRTKIYRGGHLSIKALVNQAYAGYTAISGRQGMADFKFLHNTAGRMRTVTDRLAKYNGTDAVAYVLETLDEVSAGESTQWQVIYDQHARLAYWRSASNEALRWIDFHKIDFRCGGPVLALPIQRRITGEANPYLTRFTPDDNRKLVYRAIEGNAGVIPIPESIGDDMWQWPQKESCKKNNLTSGFTSDAVSSLR